MMNGYRSWCRRFCCRRRSIQLKTAPEDFSAVREALEAEGIEFLEADVKMIPDTVKLEVKRR